MKRWLYPLSVASLLLLIGWGLAKTGWFWKNRAEPVHQVQRADPMETPSGWRYRQNQPHHWRYIMLQK
jgi:hypothetical protein